MYRLLVLGLACLLALPACGEDNQPASEDPTPSIGASAARTPVPTTMATGAQLNPAANPIPAAACPMGPLNSGAADMTAKQVDMDGDNDADDLIAYRLGNDWHLRVELTSGGGAEAVVPGIDPAVSHLKALGSFDIGGGPTQEAFATVGAGASTDLIGIWTLDGCALQRVTLNGDPDRVPCRGHREQPVGLDVPGERSLDCVWCRAQRQQLCVVRDRLRPGRNDSGRPSSAQPFTFADTEEANIEFSSWFECGGMTLD